MSGRIALIVLLATFVAAVIWDSFDGRAGDYSKPHQPITMLPVKSVVSKPSGALDTVADKQAGDEKNIVRLGAAAGSRDTADRQDGDGEVCQPEEMPFQNDKTSAKLLAAQAQV